jgi:hypothetical protein
LSGNSNITSRNLDLVSRRQSQGLDVDSPATQDRKRRERQAELDKQQREQDLRERRLNEANVTAGVRPTKLFSRSLQSGSFRQRLASFGSRLGL